MSLNGTFAPTAQVEARDAMDRVRASNLLVVESVRNFSGDSHAGQFSETLVGTDLSNKDWFLFGVRVDSNLQAAPENGAPGALADRTLAVVADGIEVAKIGGGTELVTGNSLAAPAIAGAAALLKQYWPQLGGKEISRILLDSAKDLGAPGVDQIYGVGLLDLENALKPKDASVAYASYVAAANAAQGLTFSGAFGSADGAKRWADFAGQVTAIDRYGRDFAAKCRRRRPRPRSPAILHIRCDRRTARELDVNPAQPVGGSHVGQPGDDGTPVRARPALVRVPVRRHRRQRPDRWSHRG